VALLKSNILREKMVERYNLMPILFYEKWDPEKKTWKKSGFSLNPMTYVSKALNALRPPPPSLTKKDPDIPDMWDALRLLDKIIDVTFNMKDNTITITVIFPTLNKRNNRRLPPHDPDRAMSSEAKRVAQTNRKYLEETTLHHRGSPDQTEKLQPHCSTNRNGNDGGSKGKILPSK
jgi:hypothetical protein